MICLNSIHVSKMSEIERMSPDLLLPDSNISHCSLSLQDEPRDLSIKRKLRPVPPPLDLSKRTLEPYQLSGLIVSPRSPFAQKNLPLRKRAYSWSSQPENLGMQIPSGGVIQRIVEAAKNDSNLQANLPTAPSSSSSSLKFYGLSTPHTPHTPHPHSAIPVITSRFNFGEHMNGTSISNCQVPLNLSTTSVGALPSSLLSPAPSHPSSSSLNSSREELESETMMAEYQIVSPSLSSHVGVNSCKQQCVMTSMDYSNEESPVDVINVSSHQNNGHHWPTSVWSIFLAGVQIHFVLGGGQITGARLSEDLGQLERTHHQQYAPHGLHLLRTIIDKQGSGHYNNSPSFCQLYFRPVAIQQEDIMVIAPPDHPFYVHGKGWCSLLVDQATDTYNIPCQLLQEGDICLPPHHPETTSTPIPVVTPDLTDAMKRFDFNDENYEAIQGSCSAPPSATFPPQTHRSVFLSPPASPSKKNNRSPLTGPNLPMIGVHNINDNMGSGGICPKSRRPMNGFMLFAKHHRLKLIQQYPGKDNRAISVLLGAMWKALPDEDRERFNCEARVQAEERKRIDPDCWKRKRSHSTS